jgi:hypothetical protein
LELAPIFRHSEIGVESDLERPLDPRIRTFYPFLPEDENANEFMPQYIRKYGLFGRSEKRETLVNALSTEKPQFFCTEYLRYLIEEFDVELSEISK